MDESAPETATTATSDGLRFAYEVPEAEETTAACADDQSAVDLGDLMAKMKRL